MSIGQERALEGSYIRSSYPPQLNPLQYSWIYVKIVHAEDIWFEFYVTIGYIPITELELSKN